MSFLVIKSYLSLLWFDCLLARGSFANFYERVRRYPVRTIPERTDAVQKVRAAVDMACIWYWKEVLCLHRSAVTTVLMRRYGIPAQLIIGVQKMPFKAHAWVEINGLVVNDRFYVQDQYAVLDRL